MSVLSFRLGKTIPRKMIAAIIVNQKQYWMRDLGGTTSTSFKCSNQKPDIVIPASKTENRNITHICS